MEGKRGINSDSKVFVLDFCVNDGALSEDWKPEEGVDLGEQCLRIRTPFGDVFTLRCGEQQSSLELNGEDRTNG